jgi:hypothetical protein
MTIARMYAAAGENLAFGGTADRSLFEIKAGSAQIVVVHGFRVTSDYTTDERARLRLAYYSTDGTGTAITETKLNSGNGNPNLAAVIHTVTPGTVGGIIDAWRWSQQGELLFLPTPELRPILQASERLALNLQAALGAARNWSFSLWWEEL